MKWKPEQVTEWKLLVNNDLLFSHNALCIFACLSFRRRYTIFLVSCSKNMHARTHTHMYVCTHACTHAHTYTSTNTNTHGGVKLAFSLLHNHTHTHTQKRVRLLVFHHYWTADHNSLAHIPCLFSAGWAGTTIWREANPSCLRPS